MLQAAEDLPRDHASSSGEAPSQAELYRAGRLFLIQQRVGNDWRTVGNRSSRGHAHALANAWAAETGAEYRVSGNDVAIAHVATFKGRMLSTRRLLERDLRNEQHPFDVTLDGYGEMRIFAGCRQEAIDTAFRMFGVSDRMRPRIDAKAIEVQP